MKQQVCAVRDTALDAYMRPIYAQTVIQAQRMFLDAINQRDSEMNAHPEDYNLYHLGEWNDGNAEYKPLANGPALISRGLDCIRQRDIS